MSVGRKVIFSALISIILLFTVVATMEVGARFYGKMRGREIVPNRYEPNLPPESAGSLSGPSIYKLDTDFSYQKATHYSAESVHHEPIHAEFSELKENQKLIQVRVLTKTSDGRIVYNTIYNFDKKGRRYTLDNSGDTKHSFHIAFAGCSHVFGEGLLDEETLPSQFAKANETFKVYNLAVRGGSVADHIHDIQKSEKWDDMLPRKGLLIISFDATLHMSRFVGTLRHVGMPEMNSHHVSRNSSTGRYEFDGMVKEKRPLWYFLSRIVVNSQFLNLIKFDMPFIDASDFADYADAISDLISYYKIKYPGSTALVYINPMNAESRMIIPFLEKLKIYYFDYSDFIPHEYATKPTQIPIDGHPSAEYNRVMAEQLSHDLNLEKNKARLNLNLRGL